MPTCPNCGHVLAPSASKARTLKAVPTTDTAQMSDAELYAHYKRTAPLEDLRFWLNHARMSEDLRAGFRALQLSAEQLTIPRASFYKQLTALQNLWRRERNAAQNREAERKWRAGLAYRKACADLIRTIHAATDPELSNRPIREKAAYVQTREVCRLAAELMPWKFADETKAA